MLSSPPVLSSGLSRNEIVMKMLIRVPPHEHEMSRVSCADRHVGKYAERKGRCRIV